MGDIQARKSAHISSQPHEDKTKEREIVSTRGYVSRPKIGGRSVEIGGIHKHVGEKTVDGVPSTENEWKMRGK